VEQRQDEKQREHETSIQGSNRNAEQELITLSREKWRWMSERKIDSLDALIHEKAVFVHMGARLYAFACFASYKSFQIDIDHPETFVSKSP